MKRLSGTEIAASIYGELKTEVDSLIGQEIKPCLAVILVGEDPASAIYVNSKRKKCEELGIRSVAKNLPINTTQAELLAVVKELNEDPTVHGILCQVPLPKQLNEDEVILNISPDKDVDCFHPYNVGLLATGMPRYMPCTPYGVLQIIKRSGYETSGKNVVVLGRSNIVGRPMSILLSQKGYDSTVTVCHSRTKNLEAVCKEADILVAAIGVPHFVTKDFVKPGAIVLDVGTNRIDDPTHPKGKRLVGDVLYADIEDIAEAATPVPGGVGPMTICMLMYNCINAARAQNNLDLFEL